MVVPEDFELDVPGDAGEYFIGWTILNQPANTDMANLENPTNGNKAAQVTWAQNNGYKIHNGPGVMFLTGGDFPHFGTQEPYLLTANDFPMPRAKESEEEYALRQQNQLPTAHWRLDTPDIILKSLEQGAYTEANVGAGQKMLASIGTKVSIHKESRSKNFLGRYYQELLADPEAIQNLPAKYSRQDNHVYEIEELTPDRVYLYGVKQQKNQANPNPPIYHGY